MNSTIKNDHLSFLLYKYKSWHGIVDADFKWYLIKRHQEKALGDVKEIQHFLNLSVPKILLVK